MQYAAARDLGAQAARCILQVLETARYLKGCQGIQGQRLLSSSLRSAAQWDGLLHLEVAQLALASGADPTRCEAAHERPDGVTEGLCGLHVAAMRASLPHLQLQLQALACAGNLGGVNVESMPGSQSSCMFRHCFPHGTMRMTPLTALLRGEANGAANRWRDTGEASPGGQWCDPVGCLRLLLTVPQLDLHYRVQDPEGAEGAEDGPGVPLAQYASRHWPSPLTDLLVEEVRGVHRWSAPRAAWAAAVARGALFRAQPRQAHGVAGLAFGAAAGRV